MPGVTLSTLRAEAAGCHACDLWQRATQTVFGAGDTSAPLMLVGEQPGDIEDRRGEPFVGPAGRLLDEALERARIDRTRAYVTNVVKHFKWEPRGKRRLHSKPNQVEIDACRRWLDAEIALVRPRVVVCLGATAARALVGKDVRVTRDRGQPLPSTLARQATVVVTVHPSSILRAPDDDARHAEMAAFVRDLVNVAALLE